jgi:DNA invertase Pin-like site-specific DNA recombinase
MGNATAYVRFSSDMQDENSFDFQFRGIRDYAAKQGDVFIYEPYSDDAASGKDTNRQGFIQMLADIESARIKVERVYVYKFSRFMRNSLESRLAKRRLERLGVKVISTTEPIPEGHLGDFMETIIEGMDEFQSHLTGELSLAGSREVARKQYWLGGPAPYGYRLTKVPDREGCKREDQTVMRGDLEINEEEAKVVRRIFEIAAKTGKGGFAIYKQLCEDFGYMVLGRKGQPLGGRTVNAILRNPIYRGCFIYNKYGYEPFIEGVDRRGNE